MEINPLYSKIKIYTYSKYFDPVKIEFLCSGSKLVLMTILNLNVWIRVIGKHHCYKHRLRIGIQTGKKENCIMSITFFIEEGIDFHCERKEEPAFPLG